MNPLCSVFGVSRTCRAYRAHAFAAALCLLPAAAQAQSSLAGERISVTHLHGTITIDGDLSDEAWQQATKVERWYEVQPGDNTAPKVRSVGYLAYDDQAFYAAFEFDDPNPGAIRAPYSDRDNIDGTTNDYGGILIDARNTGTTGTFFMVTPRNTQYDSITDDSSGEDASPDFFWDSAARINAHGWTVEMRIPFSSLRYGKGDPQTWRILLYRNYPRDFRYQLFSAKLPRDGNCLVCRANVLTGLEGLPGGGHIVAAPYIVTSDIAQPSASLGSPVTAHPAKARFGGDMKWLPDANNAIDLTLWPDFSQVESDTAQIAANQRFALFYPEKRPFFLEGIDLFATPIQAVYTRTISSPTIGVRATGTEGGMHYTVLLADDDGGGSAVLPGPTSSSLAPADFGSTVLIARVKKSIGLSFVSVLATDRERRNGAGFNRVVGPDFLWRRSGSDVVSGQWLFSATKTPVQPELAGEWTGQDLTGGAGVVQWTHNETHLDWNGMYRDIGTGFRADTGFVPQVGYRELFGQTGWTVRPTNFLSRLRMFVTADRQVDRQGDLLSRSIQPTAGMDTKFAGFMQFRYVDEQIRTPVGAVVGRRQFGYIVQLSPGRVFTQIGLDGTLGQDIDFDNGRPGRGPTVNLRAVLRPTNHLELALIENQQSLSVDALPGVSRRLFTARVSRVKGTYNFSSRLFVRLIGQYVSTDRDPSLFRSPVAPADGDFSGSALLAYKLNWQSVLFLGYGDDRELTDRHRLAGLDRQVFLKMSYAFQR